MPEARHYDASLCETRKSSQAEERLCHRAFADFRTDGAWSKSKTDTRSKKNIADSICNASAMIDFSQDVKIRKAAFTLTEVLITLGIIGVVAALTLPTLIQNYKRSQTTAQLKKFYSMMAQAVQMAEANEGMKSYEWDENTRQFAIVTDKESAEAQNAYGYYYWNRYLAPYFKTLKIEKGVYDEENAKNTTTKVYLHDGSIIYVKPGDAFDINYDVNGDKGPNKFGIDRFNFLIATKTTVPLELPKGYSFGVGFVPNLNTREKARAACVNPSTAYQCTALLYYDNFEFKKDYPYKL